MLMMKTLGDILRLETSALGTSMGAPLGGAALHLKAAKRAIPRATGADSMTFHILSAAI